jgi:hypothetical protein
VIVAVLCRRQLRLGGRLLYLAYGALLHRIEVGRRRIWRQRWGRAYGLVSQVVPYWGVSWVVWGLWLMRRERM